MTENPHEVRDERDDLRDRVRERDADLDKANAVIAQLRVSLLAYAEWCTGHGHSPWPPGALNATAALSASAENGEWLDAVKKSEWDRGHEQGCNDLEIRLERVRAETRAACAEEWAKHFETVPHYVSDGIHANLTPFGHAAAYTLRALASKKEQPDE